MKRLFIDLKERAYPLFIGSGILDNFEKYFEENCPKTSKRVLIVSNTVSQLYSHIIENYISYDLKIVISDGEDAKKLSYANEIYTKLIENNIDRLSVIIAFGGGVVGDLAGFIAATFMRGIRLVQIPSTLLAQVDSSIGGKVAVNHPLGKNLIGAFHQPKFVVLDIELLKTLPPRELISGLGEVIKYGIIWDESFCEFISAHYEDIENLETNVLTNIVEKSCAIKSAIIVQDEFDQNLRTILNFGHTIGHAIEGHLKYSGLRHGEAILIGMKAASTISKKMGRLDETNYQKICDLIDKNKISLENLSIDVNDIVKRLKADKKVVKGKTRFILPEKIGDVFVTSDIPAEIVLETIQEIKLEFEKANEFLLKV
ncbi:MAG: 3-dehydroquinate synthase [Calditrichaeota bacterium]|nr:MAG: 3-dehydroquinate synthase [Calditrichota bacterium]